MQAFNVMPGKPSATYSIASTGSRIGAFMIDAVLMTFYFAVMAISFLNSDVDDFSSWMSFVVAPPLLYPLFFEIVGKGQSLGKRALNIRVISIDGTQPNIAQYFARWLVGLMEINLSFGVIATVVVAVSEQGQRLGDVLAGTRVVKAGASLDPYVPVFPQSTLLQSYDAELIQRALIAARQFENPVPVQLVAEKMKVLLGIHTELAPEQFLAILREDYLHRTRS
jgi:uncharacterized RDD family membrane protein YckC